MQYARTLSNGAHGRSGTQGSPARPRRLGRLPPPRSPPCPHSPPRSTGRARKRQGRHERSGAERSKGRPPCRGHPPPPRPAPAADTRLTPAPPLSPASPARRRGTPGGFPRGAAALRSAARAEVGASQAGGVPRQPVPGPAPPPLTHAREATGSTSSIAPRSRPPRSHARKNDGCASSVTSGNKTAPPPLTGGGR